MNPGSFTFSTMNGLSVFGRAWVSPVKKPKGIVYLAHDLGEHSGRYDPVGKTLTKAGYHLAGFDLRGHGLSEGRRGHSPGFSHLIEDIHLFVAETEKYLDTALPKFFYGQGLGGNLVIHYGIHNPSGFCGAIVTSPALKTSLPQPKVKHNFLRFIAKLTPRLTLKSGLDPDALSRNATIVKAYQSDVYNHDKLSARLGLDLVESGRTALEDAHQWSVPLLLMHGTADQIASDEASQEFARKAGDHVEFVRWKGYYHELHNDLGSEIVIEKMIEWMDRQIN